MSKRNLREINRMGRRLAKKCINESRRRVLAESDNWRDNHMDGTADNTKAFERWLQSPMSQGYTPEYIQAIGQLNSWVGGGAEKNGLIDWSTGFPVLRQDAYAEFANGDNNWFKRNNAKERNDWFNNLAGIVQREEARRNANPYGGQGGDQGGGYGGGYNPYGGGYDPYGGYYDPYGGYGGGMPYYGMPPYGGGGNDDIFRYMMINDYLRAQDVARNEAAAHPNQASGAPSLNPMLPLLMMSAGGGRPYYPTSMPPYGGGMPPYGGGVMPNSDGVPPMTRGGGMTPPNYGPNPALYGRR